MPSTSTRDDGTGMGMGFTTECLVSSRRMGKRKSMWKCTKTKAQIAVEKLYSSTRAKYTEANNRSVVMQALFMGVISYTLACQHFLEPPGAHDQWLSFPTFKGASPPPTHIF